MTAMAYAFAISFLNQYPSEKVGPSNFACDTTIRNAKFATSLQALAVPVSDEEQPIFDMLNEQNFTLHLSFINTLATCRLLTISEISASSTISLGYTSCTDQNGTLSAKISLPQHDIKVQAVIDDIQLVGGVKVGLSSPSLQNDPYSLQGLNFTQTFYSKTAQTLAQEAVLELAITKVCFFNRILFMNLLSSLYY